MSRGIRPSTTRSTAALWAKSLLNAFLFFALFMVAAPLAAERLLPNRISTPAWMRFGAAPALFLGGIVVWAIGLDVFSRRGRGTPFPLDDPRVLATSGPFAVIRNPIIAAELLVIWAEALYLSSLGVYVYAVVATLGGQLAVRYVEEPELKERFGAQYEEYCRRVPRWLPHLRARQNN